jgi:plastocyanin
MRRSLVVLTIALAALLSACTSSSAPGWTYAPPTAAPASQPAPSGDASAAPSSAAPSAAAPSGAAPSDNGSGGGGDVVELSAMMIQYEQTDLKAPADKNFVLRFDNKDAGTPHNVEIKDANNQSVFKGEIFNGVAVKDYAVPALAAGTYQFVCSVHPNMVGTLTVGG